MWVFAVLFFFLLIYDYRLKTNDCVYFFTPSFKEYYAPAPWPCTSHSQSNQTQAQKMSSGLPVSGLCLPENVLFNCFGIILMWKQSPELMLLYFPSLQSFMEFCEGGNKSSSRMTVSWRELSRGHFIYGSQGIIFTGYIWRSFLSIKRLLQETCDEVSQTFSWQVSWEDMQLNVEMKPSGISEALYPERKV